MQRSLYLVALVASSISSTTYSFSYFHPISWISFHRSAALHGIQHQDSNRPNKVQHVTWQQLPAAATRLVVLNLSHLPQDDPAASGDQSVEFLDKHDGAIGGARCCGDTGSALWNARAQNERKRDNGSQSATKSYDLTLSVTAIGAVDDGDISDGNYAQHLQNEEKRDETVRREEIGSRSTRPGAKCAMSNRWRRGGYFCGSAVGKVDDDAPVSQQQRHVTEQPRATRVASLPSPMVEQQQSLTAPLAGKSRNQVPAATTTPPRPRPPPPPPPPPPSRLLSVRVASKTLSPDELSSATAAQDVTSNCGQAGVQVATGSHSEDSSADAAAATAAAVGKVGDLHEELDGGAREYGEIGPVAESYERGRWLLGLLVLQSTSSLVLDHYQVGRTRERALRTAILVARGDETRGFFFIEFTR